MGNNTFIGVLFVVLGLVLFLIGMRKRGKALIVLLTPTSTTPKAQASAK
jgi:hypothetical protein